MRIKVDIEYKDEFQDYLIENGYFWFHFNKKNKIHFIENNFPIIVITNKPELSWCHIYDNKEKTIDYLAFKRINKLSKLSKLEI